MSRKNRNKFRNREANRPAVVAHSGSADAPARVVSGGGAGAFAQHTAEYRIIGRDLVRVVILNGIMLGALLVLYYVNRSSGIVEKLFHQIF